MQVEAQTWHVSFMYYDQGYFDMDTCSLEAVPNPFVPSVLRCDRYKLSTMSPACTFFLVGPRSGLEPSTYVFTKTLLVKFLYKSTIYGIV
jgi:hypothetical protein